MSVLRVYIDMSRPDLILNLHIEGNHFWGVKQIISTLLSCDVILFWDQTEPGYTFSSVPRPRQSNLIHQCVLANLYPLYRPTEKISLWTQSQRG